MENQAEKKEATQLTPEQQEAQKQHAQMMQNTLKAIVGATIVEGPQAGMGQLVDVLNRQAQMSYQAGVESRHLQSYNRELLLKNQKNNAEILRVTMDGKIFVDGEETINRQDIGDALARWQQAAMAAVKKQEEAAPEEKPVMKARKGGKAVKK